MVAERQIVCFRQDGYPPRFLTRYFRRERGLDWGNEDENDYGDFTRDLLVVTFNFKLNFTGRVVDLMTSSSLALIRRKNLNNWKICSRYSRCNIIAHVLMTLLRDDFNKYGCTYYPTKKKKNYKYIFDFDNYLYL